MPELLSIKTGKDTCNRSRESLDLSVPRNKKKDIRKWPLWHYTSLLVFSEFIHLC